MYYPRLEQEIHKALTGKGSRPRRAGVAGGHGSFRVMETAAQRRDVPLRIPLLSHIAGLASSKDTLRWGLLGRCAPAGPP